MLSTSISQVLYKRRGICQYKEPKTSHSRRRVAMTPKLALYLREYKTEREWLNRQLGKPFTLDDLVFTGIEGKPIDPGVLSHSFGRLAVQAGLENVRFHDLRHTFASLMLLRGAKPKIISEALDHSSVAFTMDVYSHIIDGIQSDAMALLDELLPAGVSQKINANLRIIGDKRQHFSFKCQRSSGVEQRFRKPPVVGSNPTAGSVIPATTPYTSI